MRQITHALVVTLIAAALIVVGQVVVTVQDTGAAAQLTSTTCPGSGCLTIDTTGGGSGVVRVAGTWTGTLVFEAALEQSDYFAIEGTPPTGTVAPVSSVTTNGTWVVSVAGYRSLRVRASSLSSGQAQVTVRVGGAAHVIRPLGTPTNSGGGPSGGLTNTELREAPLATTVGNFPATQPVSLASVPSHPVTNAGTFAVQVTSAPTTAVTGTVGINNFPSATTVSNFPASQAVTGPLTDAQLRAQALPVSLASTTITNFPSSQTVAGTVAVSNFPASTSVSNFPATQTTREVSNTGRALVGISYTATAPTTADTVVTGLVKATAGSAAAGAQSITPAASKTLRLVAANVQVRTTTAALPWALVTLRVSSTTTCTAASSVLAYLAAGGTAAVIGNVGQFATQWPEGLDLPAGGSVCVSVSGNVTTNVLTVSLQGFEF